MTATQVVQAFIEWPAISILFGGSLGAWIVRRVRRVRRSRSAESLDRTVAGSVAVKGLSRSLRQEGVPDDERRQLIIELWRRHFDLDDPPDT